MNEIMFPSSLCKDMFSMEKAYCVILKYRPPVSNSAMCLAPILRFLRNRGNVLIRYLQANCFLYHLKLLLYLNVSMFLRDVCTETLIKNTPNYKIVKVLHLTLHGYFFGYVNWSQ